MQLPVNIVDVLLGLVIAVGVAIGWSRGFIASGLALATLAASLFVAFWCYRYPAALLEQRVPELGVWTRPLSFLIALVVARIVFGSLAHRAGAAVARKVHSHAANRALGIVPGAMNGFIAAALVAMLLLTLPLLDGLSVAARDSLLAARLATPVEWLETKLSPIFREAADRTLSKLIVQPESTQRIDLHFTVANAKPRADLETRMIELINEARIKEGLRPLQPDPALAQVARAHSRDMFARGYFSHIAPEGTNPFERMRKANVRFFVAGENVALAPTLLTAHRGLMDSPGHRANILRPAFGRVGIGVLDGGRYGLMVTQNFRN